MSKSNLVKGRKIYIDWVQYISDVRKLYAKLSSLLNVYNSFNIVSLGRGGSIPAVMISHLTNVPNNVYNIGLMNYDDVTHDKQNKIIVYQDLHEIKKINKKPVLIIDDLIDSGDSMKYVFDKYFSNVENDIIIATVYNKNKSFNRMISEQEKKVEFLSGTMYSKNKWLIFPYED